MDTLRLHGFLRGNDPDTPVGLQARARRLFCSNRGNHQGCGRTVSVFLSRFLLRRSPTTSRLYAFLKALVKGQTVQAAGQAHLQSFSEPSWYRWETGLRATQAHLRAWLCGNASPPPASAHSDPLAATLAHLRAAFPAAADPLASFQLASGLDLFGTVSPGGSAM